MSKTTPPPNQTSKENPDEDILNHPLFCDGLPSNFQDNVAFNALAYIDSEEYHPKSPINTNSIKNRTPTTPREIQNQFQSGPVRRQKSGLNRRTNANPYSNTSRTSVGGLNNNEEEYNAFGHRRRSSVKMRSRNSDGPLARESHLASYLCSIADDEHSLPKKPSKFPIETVYPERVSFSSSQAPGLLTLREGDIMSNSELDLNSLTSRATSETREDGHTSPPKLVAPCATPTTSVGRDGDGNDKKSSFVMYIFFTSLKCQNSFINLDCRFFEFVFNVTKIISKFIQTNFTKNRQQLQQHASQIPIPDDTFGSRLTVPDDA